MAQGEIRRGKENSEQIPLVPPVWFMVVTVKRNKIKEMVFQTTKIDKEALLEFLVLNRQYCKVYGIWNGKWNTHIFDMDIEVLKRRLEKDTHLNEKIIKKNILNLINSLSSKIPLKELLKDIAETRNVTYSDLKYLVENQEKNK